jgi:hypothetical protein
VETKYLNRTVKRHLKRFPADFMFQLTDKEWEILRCQIGTAKKIEKMRFNPYVFTEQGIAMLSGLLNSDIAINVNIQIMRVFVQLRHYVITKTDTNKQIAEPAVTNTILTKAEMYAQMKYLRGGREKSAGSARCFFSGQDPK